MPFHTPAERRDGILSRVFRPKTNQVKAAPMGFDLLGRLQGKGKAIKSPPIIGIAPKPFMKARPTAKPVVRPLISGVSRRARTLAEPAAVLKPNVSNAVIGERRRLSPEEIAVARKAAPKAVDPNKVRLANRQTPRVVPRKPRLQSFGGIRVRGSDFG